MAGTRRLSAGEIALWREVAATVEPRPGAALPDLPAPPAPPPSVISAPIAARRTFYAAPYVPPVSSPKPGPTGLERRYRRRVATGLIGVDAALDLHGLTQARAHAAVIRFVSGAQRDGLRLVIIVTGKGLRARGDGAEGGALRRLLPFWLRSPALAPAVIGFEEAARHHGGAGALYVRLRRPAT